MADKLESLFSKRDLIEKVRDTSSADLEDLDGKITEEMMK